MKISYAVWGLLLLMWQGCSSNNRSVEVYTTTAQQSWAMTQTILKTGTVQEADIILSDSVAQEIEGFGGTFNELGWDALSLLSPALRDSVMQQLVGAEGLHFSFCRFPIGSNDFARDWYSYDEFPGDFAMEHFSIERDFTGLIPYIKAALAVNPQLRLWASPWSPPLWMKSTRHYATAPGDFNDFTEANEVAGDHFIQEPDYLNAYVLYLSKFVKAYKEQGIDISLLYFQNEPYTKQQWPNCSWIPSSMANFIGNYLGPWFQAEHPQTELYFGTFNCNQMEDLDTVMNHSTASKYIRGIGLQWEGKDIVAEVHRRYPTMKLMQTENECGGGSFDWGSAEHTFDLLQIYLNGGCNSYMYWNMVLADEGASTWGWRQNALVRVDSKSKQVTYTPEFYVMKHLSHFVPAGSHQLGVKKGNDVLAFQTPDHRTVVVAANKSEQPRPLQVAASSGHFTATLAPKSFTTFVF